MPRPVASTLAPERLKYAPPQVREIGNAVAGPARAEGDSLPPVDDLDDVALQLRTLAYRDFMTFAEAIGADPARVWAWALERKVKL